MVLDAPELSVVVVDKYGRIKIPKKYLKELKARRFLVKKSGDSIVLVPLKERDLTKYFDSVEVDVEPDAWEDYNTLKKALLGD